MGNTTCHLSPHPPTILSCSLNLPSPFPLGPLTLVPQSSWNALCSDPLKAAPWILSGLSKKLISSGRPSLISSCCSLFSLACLMLCTMLTHIFLDYLFVCLPIVFPFSTPPQHTHILLRRQHLTILFTAASQHWNSTCHTVAAQ